MPFTVHFINQSSGPISGYLWNFGDGTLSDQANPEHVYSTPGVYTVTLTASGPGGQSSAQAVIRVNLPPTPTLQPTPPQSVVFTAQVDVSTNSVDETSNDQLIHTANLWLGTIERQGSYAGFRFNDVQIPPGARILSAHLEFYLLRDRTEPLELVVVAQASDNSAPFTNVNPPAARLLTEQQIRLRIDEPWLAGNWYELGDLAPVIQEVISRPGWLNGNSLSIIIGVAAGGVQDPSWVSSYLESPELAPRLVVVYQMP